MMTFIHFLYLSLILDGEFATFQQQVLIGMRLEVCIPHHLLGQGVVFEVHPVQQKFCSSQRALIKMESGLEVKNLMACAMDFMLAEVEQVNLPQDEEFVGPKTGKVSLLGFDYEHVS